mgnify:CR=1 FL=1
MRNTAARAGPTGTEEIICDNVSGFLADAVPVLLTEGQKTPTAEVPSLINLAEDVPRGVGNGRPSGKSSGAIDRLVEFLFPFGAFGAGDEELFDAT